MKELTMNEILKIVCAPAITDEPEESDFIASDEANEISEEQFVRKLIMEELN